MIGSSCLPRAAFAAETPRLDECLHAGYGAMTNRNAIVAAVIDSAGSRIMTFGAAKEDQLFEIGSITKTFTANLLAQSVNEHLLGLADPIPMAYQKAGTEITYRHLVTHTSGIVAGIFPGFTIKNPDWPYQGFDLAVFLDLYARTPLDFSPGTSWAYSNLGFSLLGLLLGERLESPYMDQVRRRIFDPLGMKDSFFQVPESEKRRFPTGFMIDETGQRKAMPHWDLHETAVAPAGGIRSMIEDMVKYAQANLVGDGSSAFSSAAELAQQPLYYVDFAKSWIGMSWVVQPARDLVWHNGETYGFNSILALSKKSGRAVVAMTDTTVLLKKDSEGNTSFDNSLEAVAFKCLGETRIAP